MPFQDQREAHNRLSQCPLVRITVTADCYVLAFTSAVAGLQIVERTITSRIVIDPKGLQSPERNATPRENLVMLWLFCG